MCVMGSTEVALLTPDGWRTFKDLRLTGQRQLVLPEDPTRWEFGMVRRFKPA